MSDDGSNKNNEINNKEAAGKIGEKNLNETVTFYYDREERLKKLKNLRAERERVGFFKKGGKRTLLIVLVDILIISLFIYLINRPTNFYKRKNIGDFQYELNISGIRGKKVMFALTITNKAFRPVKINREEQISISIVDASKNKYNFKKIIGEDTTLQPTESTSIVFMAKEAKLPKSGIVNVYVGDNDKPVFSPRVRFYYFIF